jgi:hypothetical protein
MRVDDDKKKSVITILATAIAYLLASRLADRFVDQPEVRGIRDDLKEGFLSAASSLILTIVASVVIRRVVGSRQGFPGTNGETMCWIQACGLSLCP